MQKIPTIWVDKDGVLAQYDYSLYEADMDSPAPWNVRNAHVYRHLQPYTEMVEAFRRIYFENRNVKPEKRKLNIRVLTGVSDGLTLSEHVLDGYAWCDEYLDLRPNDFYACAIAKENIPVTLHNTITPLDILVDDYVPNLQAWVNAGGTPVKAINGINSELTSMLSVNVLKPAAEIVRTLEQIVDDMKGSEKY